MRKFMEGLPVNWGPRGFDPSVVNMICLVIALMCWVILFALFIQAFRANVRRRNRGIRIRKLMKAESVRRHLATEKPEPEIVLVSGGNGKVRKFRLYHLA